MPVRPGKTRPGPTNQDQEKPVRPNKRSNKNKKATRKRKPNRSSSEEEEEESEQEEVETKRAPVRRKKAGKTGTRQAGRTSQTGTSHHCPAGTVPAGTASSDSSLSLAWFFFSGNLLLCVLELGLLHLLLLLQNPRRKGQTDFA